MCPESDMKWNLVNSAFLNNKAWNHPFLCIGCLTDLNILSSSLLGHNESASYIQEKKKKTVLTTIIQRVSIFLEFLYKFFLCVLCHSFGVVLAIGDIL